MTPPKKNTGNTDTRLSVVEYKVDELKIGMDRSEAKTDQIIDQLQKLNYVNIGEHEQLKAQFQDFKQEVKDNYITKESRKDFKMFWVALGTASAISFTALILNWVVKGGLVK